MEVIDNILYYIHQHFDEDLSLQALSQQAHYSPYHFHRLFKQHTGEAPRQYLLRLRLEKATKELLFYPGKSIYAIAIDCGFSSQSVFARAFRAKYGITAEQYRQQALQAIREKTDAFTPDVQQYPVTTTRMERIHMACEITYLAQEAGIVATFRKLYQWALVRELISGRPEFYGVYLDTPHTTAPEQCRYLAGIRLDRPFAGRESYALGGMTIAQIPVMGGFEVATAYALYVKQRWLHENGYEMIQGVPGFERFTDMDFNKPYSLHYRTICIGIQPA
ncbi:AraC family transcriptional regulator [Chitinophaga japonensis]|uniref:AraC family transcriptional regulator n=1 Tax=Chitinophaga japonensis TaxID=104662 RepID=A0A562T4L1_CHIJA|nr:AraC family transcriptional regulator [Chitinophaga japonensis]TWI87996.1 AraC family transcriptional regulator [Chitinophaga japonensis]